ncbi:hypothetical protein GCM10018790_75510 [Kitasatospora xanthocidica]|nr:hypothetical protein GCM10018790_75510 [Kitasatospora xanthocidica]
MSPAGDGTIGRRPTGSQRNTVEQAIHKLRHLRAAMTRYDRRRYVYLGTLTAAALVIRLRT